MGRIRTVKPEWLEDERLLEAGSDARVMSVALILLSDDYGRGRGNVKWLAAQVFAFEEDSHAKVRESLAALSGWFLGTYEVRGQSYFQILNWAKHQRVDKPGKPHVPAPSQGKPANIRETPGTDQDQDHDQEGDPEREGGLFDRPAWVAAFKRITGRSDFADKCGELTGVETEFMRVARDVCSGDLAIFENRVQSLVDSRPDGFYKRQGLRYWTESAIKAPVDTGPNGGKTFAQRVKEQVICEY